MYIGIERIIIGAVAGRSAGKNVSAIRVSRLEGIGSTPSPNKDISSKLANIVAYPREVRVPVVEGQVVLNQGGHDGHLRFNIVIQNLSS